MKITSFSIHFLSELKNGIIAVIGTKIILNIVHFCL